MNGTLVTPEPHIDRDRYGRPMVVPPFGGKPIPYTRCTTFIDCIEDKFNLTKWMMRQTALGLSQRPDLLLAVSAHKDDKRELDRICDSAKEAAASSAAATTGTAIHALTELIDRGQELPVLPDQARADLDAYRLATEDLTSVLIEQFCVLDTLKIGGTPDRVVEYGGRRYIADIKTGSIEFGTLKIASQLAVYSRSRTYDIRTHARGMHEADTSRGIIIHVPAGEGTATLHWVDLEVGWYAVQTAKDVREKRALKFNDLTEPFGPIQQPSGVQAEPGPTNSAPPRSAPAPAPTRFARCGPTSRTSGPTSSRRSPRSTSPHYPPPHDLRHHARLAERRANTRRSKRMSEFVSAAPPSGGIDWEDLKGKLLIVEPLSVEAGIKTSFGDKTAVKANVHVLTGPGESEDYDDALLFPTLLVSQTKNQIGQRVVGRLGQGTAKPGQKPPWLLEEATEDDIAKAREWLVSRASAVTTAQAPF